MAKKKDYTDIKDDQIVDSYAEQINYLQNLVGQMQQNIDDLDKLKTDLLDAEIIEPGQEIMAPIANGIFIKANIADSKKLLINIGKGVVVEKTIPATIILLEKQQKEIEESRTETISKLEQLYAMLYKKSLER